uniref:FUN14 domain containing 1 n=1 Tax=Nothobranchius pienaari TaxID=704102 RepID=A0A1A8LCG5_9TELE
MATAEQREAGQDDPESDDEVYEVVDLTEYARRHQWWSRVFGNSSGPIAEKYSVATQLVMGGVTGWCAGYVFQRVGKIAATAVGGGFLLLQIANHSGYVQVDWKKVEKDVNKAKKHLKKKADKAAPEINTFIEEVKVSGTKSCFFLLLFKSDSAHFSSQAPKMSTFLFVSWQQGWCWFLHLELNRAL